VEETLARIALMGGVEGYVIADVTGVVLRQSKSFSSETASTYAREVLSLTRRARHVVRDLDPKVRLGSALLAQVRSRCLHLPSKLTPPLSTSTSTSLPSQNDLEFFRLRLKSNKEILASLSDNSIVVVVQTWKTAGEQVADPLSH